MRTFEKLESRNLMAILTATMPATVSIESNDPDESPYTFAIEGDATFNFTLDIDGDGMAYPLSDGILIVRRMAGFEGQVLVNGAVNPEGTRTDPDLIAQYVDEAVQWGIFDVDADGESSPLSDGILVVRYLAGFQGSVLTDGAANPDGQRSDPDDISTFLDQFMPDEDPVQYFTASPSNILRLQSLSNQWSNRCRLERMWWL